MSFKTTYWLFAILLVIVAIFATALILDPLPMDLDAYLFPSARDGKNALESKKVVKVVIDRARPEQETITLERDAKHHRWWIKGDKSDVEADRVLVERLIDETLALQRSNKTPLGDASQRGLNPPAATATFTLVDGKTLTLKVGDSTAGDKTALTYVQTSDRPEVLAVKKSELETYTRSVGYFRERDLLASQTTDVFSLGLSHTVDGKDKEPAIQLVKESDRWAYEAPFKGDAENLNTDTKVEPGQAPATMAAVLDQLTKLRVEYTDDKVNDFVAGGVTDWAKYGLEAGADLLTIEVGRNEQRSPALPQPEPGEATAEADLKNKRKLVVALGKKVGEKADKFYARRVGENAVYMVPAAPVLVYLELLKHPAAVRDRRLLTLDSERRVPDAFKIKVEGGSELEFYKRDKEAPWQLYRSGTDKPMTADENVVKGLLTLLGQDRMIEGFPEASPTREAELGLDNPTLVASFWVDGITQEKKDGDGKPDLDARPTLKNPDKPTARLSFGKRNRERKTVYVKRELPDQPATLLEIRDVLYERLSEGALAYLDRRLPGFRPGTTDAVSTVTRVTFTHGGKTTEIVRAKEGEPWKVVEPKDLAGRLVDANAVSALLGGLNRLTASKFVTDKPTPAQLGGEFGLNPPAEKAQVTLTKDGKELTYSFLFGKESGNAGDLFVQRGGEFKDETVFTLDRSILNLFERELLDLTVFSFDPAKVQELSLRGWSGVAGVILTLDLVRKDGTTWEIKAGPNKDDFNLDNARVSQFLALLSTLRAEKFLSHGKAPEPNQKLDVKLGGLSVRVKLEGEEKPLTLLIGEADAQGYFAIASTLAGDILLLDKQQFEGVKQSIAFFKK